MTARGIRNNNPGNIEKSSIPWQGKVAGDDPRFETFDTPHNGIRALAKNILAKQDKHGLRTVREIITAWAPPHENNTEAYIKQVAFTIGVGESEQLDLHRATILIPFVMAIIRHENGLQPYNADVIGKAVADALGVEPQPVTPDTPPVVVPIATQSSATGTQPKEPKMGALAGLLPVIFQLFSSRGTAAVGRISGLPEADAAKAFAAIGSKVAEVVGFPITDAQSAAKAVAEVAADPAKVAAVEDTTIHYALVEVGGGIASARDEYAAIAKDYDNDAPWQIVFKFLFNPIHWVTGVFLYFVQQFVPALADKVTLLDPAAAMGLIVLVFAVIGVVSARWMGVASQKKE